MGSLFVNIAGTIFGILITVGFIDIVADHNNKKNWSQVNVRIKDWLLDILMRYYNYLFLNCGEMEAFIKIFNDKNLNKTEKSKLLSESITGINVKRDYMQKIILDSHLIDFYLSGYKAVLKSLDDFWKLYHLRLSHKESPIIMDLQIKLSRTIRDFEMLTNIKNSVEIAGGEFDFKMIDSSLENYSEDLAGVTVKVNELSNLLVNDRK